MRKTPKSSRIAVLDGFRGIAVIMVLFHHVLLTSGVSASNFIEGVIWKVGGNFKTGVDLFFILSGFLITGILVDSKETPGYYRNFYLRRILRIFPLYYLFLFLVFFILPVLSKYVWFIEKVPADKIWYWLYLANFKMFFSNMMPSMYVSHTWSLCIEEQFYLLWPIIIGLMSIKSLKRVLIGIIFLSLCVRVLLGALYHCSEWQIRVFTFARLDILGLGGLLAVLYRRELFNRFSGKFKIGFILLVIIALIKIIFIKVHVSVQIVYVYFGLLYAVVMIVLLASPENSILHKILNTKLLTDFGKYSYSIYLFHVPLCVIFSETILKYLKTCSSSPIILWGLFFLIASGISFGIGCFTYHFYEKYFLNLKDVIAPLYVKD